MAQLNQTPTRIQAPPRTADVGTLRDYVAKLADIMAMLAKDLDFIINGNLDVKNIRANSITADRLDVDELSAISANLGHITAGLIEAVEIFGSYIATSRTYPRCEMSTANNLFAAYQSSTRSASLVSYGTVGSAPALRFEQDGQVLSIGFDGGTVSKGTLFSSGGLELTTLSDDLRLIGIVRLIGWSYLVNNVNNRTLEQELNSKLSGNGSNGVFYVSSTPGGEADTAISVINGLAYV